MRRAVPITIVFVFILFLTMAAGCAAHSERSAKTETVQYFTDNNGHSTEPVVVEKRTTETSETTTSEEESGGLLSGTIDVAGDVLALPFRAVGGLIDFVF